MAWDRYSEVWKSCNGFGATPSKVGGLAEHAFFLNPGAFGERALPKDPSRASPPYLLKTVARGEHIVQIGRE